MALPGAPSSIALTWAVVPVPNPLIRALLWGKVDRA